MRVSLHHGPPIERNGDDFGAAVNLAARVSGEDTAYFFCSLACAAEFARQPEPGRRRAVS